MPFNTNGEKAQCDRFQRHGDDMHRSIGMDRRDALTAMNAQPDQGGHPVAARRAGQPDPRSEPEHDRAAESGMSTAATITVRVPITIRQRGGRRLVVAPDGSPGWAALRGRVDSSLIKALARAHRWKRILDDGRYGSVSELAAAEKLDRGYLGRILTLTLLAPDIVEAIMDGRQPAELGVHVLRAGFPVEWGEQRGQVAGQTARHHADTRSSSSY
jgi:hypothetical protein